MKSIHHPSVALLCLWTLGACSAGSHPSSEAGSVVPDERIETREQLLSAVDAWLKAHYQPEWTMDELIGRTVDEAFDSSDLWKELEPPVESFVVCLIKNKRFIHAIQLRTDRRHEIKVGTERGEIIRLRTEWQKALQRREWGVEPRSSPFPRRLPLPAHDTLSLDILATPAEIRDKDENPRKLTHWGIFLASALEEEKQRAKIAKEGHSHIPEFVATPQQLLNAINADRGENRQPELTLDEITVRAADEALAKDFGGELSSDVELFLECLVRNRPFVYPMRMSPDGADEIEVSSTKKRLRVPPHNNLGIDILDLPWDASTEKHRLKIDWTTITLTYDFPAEKGKAKAKQTP